MADSHLLLPRCRQLRPTWPAFKIPACSPPPGLRAKQSTCCFHSFCEPSSGLPCAFSWPHIPSLFLSTSYILPCPTPHHFWTLSLISTENESQFVAQIKTNALGAVSLVSVPSLGIVFCLSWIVVFPTPHMLLLYFQQKCKLLRAEAFPTVSVFLYSVWPSALLNRLWLVMRQWTSQHDWYNPYLSPPLKPFLKNTEFYTPSLASGLIIVVPFSTRP